MRRVAHLPYNGCESHWFFQCGTHNILTFLSRWCLFGFSYLGPNMRGVTHLFYRSVSLFGFYNVRLTTSQQTRRKMRKKRVRRYTEQQDRRSRAKLIYHACKSYKNISLSYIYLYLDNVVILCNIKCRISYLGSEQDLICSKLQRNKIIPSKKKIDEKFSRREFTIPIKFYYICKYF